MSYRDLHKRIVDRFGPVIDLKENPGVLLDLCEELGVRPQPAGSAGVQAPAAAPFGVSWMDSWVAHWIYQENLNAAGAQDQALAALLQNLVDLKFNERLGEMQRFVRNFPRFGAEPPDGGPPEPGTPPAGPERFARAGSILAAEPPDGGPPEPGTPPAGPARFGRPARLLSEEPPDGGPEPGAPPAGPARFGRPTRFLAEEPPDGGTPEPGVPPTGPDSGFMRENPWILYWFLSIKAPALLDVIDAHMTRRLNDLKATATAE